MEYKVFMAEIPAPAQAVSAWIMGSLARETMISDGTSELTLTRVIRVLEMPQPHGKTEMFFDKYPMMNKDSRYRLNMKTLHGVRPLLEGDEHLIQAYDETLKLYDKI
jgi:hypothetical protein